MTGLQVRSAPSPAEFAPFGALICRPQAHGERQFFSGWLGGPAGTAPQFHVNSVAPTELPAALTRLERHTHAAQAFVPLEVGHYLVTVAPPLPEGPPDLAALRSYLLPGTLGVIFGRGVWHAPAMVLGQPGAFAVLMWRGLPDDDQFHQIEPVALQPPQARHNTRESLGA